jgi:Ca2+-binding EF-hand superfamily protein
MINPNDFGPGELQQNLTQLQDFVSNPDHLNEQIKTYFDSFDSDQNDCLDRKELRLFLTQFFN